MLGLDQIGVGKPPEEGRFQRRKPQGAARAGADGGAGTV